MNGVREVARRLRAYLMRRRHIERQRRRLNIFSKYLPKIASFSAQLAGLGQMPNVSRLYKREVVFKDFRTTDEYRESKPFDARQYRTILIMAKNKHENNSVIMRVVGRVGSKWKVLIPEVTLEAGSEFYEMLTKRASVVKIQVKSGSKNNPGLFDAIIDGLSE